jgi:hypothetical protein
MSEPEKEIVQPTLNLSMQDARTCAGCFLVTDAETCPKCKGATSRIFVPQEVLLDQLTRHVISHVASLGAKIEALTDEIRAQNKIETGKKRFSQLKNTMIAHLSKTMSEEEEVKSGKDK